MRDEQTEVLVVGAGPVGLLTAIVAAEAGLAVKIIDQEARTTARSYACALHPRTLKLLDGMGLAAALVDQGRRIETVAFYDHESRRAEAKVSELGGAFPFLLVLPQSAVEEVLEQRLHKAGVTVNWHHRFDSCQEQGDAVTATVEELGGTATGYIVPHWETVVVKRIPVHAQFVVGADGLASLVRHRLGIEMPRLAEPEFFAAYEFEADGPTEPEVRVVVDDTTTNVLWPLAGNRHRWTFQLLRSGGGGAFPEKERRPGRFAQPKVVRRFGNMSSWWRGNAPVVHGEGAGPHVVHECGVRAAHGQAIQAEPLLAGRGRSAPNGTGGRAESVNVGLAKAAALAGILRKDPARERVARGAGGL